MKATIKPGVAIGTVTPPSSKSMAHRLLICAALAKGKSRISNVTFSEDILATLDCLEKAGAQINIFDNFVEVDGIKNITKLENVCFNCRESGSTMRFIIPLLMLSDGKKMLTGYGKLLQRPMSIYEELCSACDIYFFQSDEYIQVGGCLQSGEYTIRGDVSSQFITGLLFALSLCNGRSKIIITPPYQSKSYVDMTIDAMKTFGVNINSSKENELIIEGESNYIAQNLAVEGDYSASAFLAAFNLFGGKVDILGMNSNSLQGDKIYEKYFKLLDYGSPNLDIANCPDLAPVLMAVAAQKHGARLIHTQRLKIKESDRGAVMKQELEKFGANIELKSDEIIIHKSKLSPPKAMLCGHNDHRIVMALSLLLSIYGGEIDDSQAVSKSYPNFFKDIIKLGIEVKLSDN